MTLLDLVEGAMLAVGIVFVLYILIASPGPRHRSWWWRWRRRNWTADDWAKVPGRELFPELFRDD